MLTRATRVVTYLSRDTGQVCLSICAVVVRWHVMHCGQALLGVVCGCVSMVNEFKLSSAKLPSRTTTKPHRRCPASRGRSGVTWFDAERWTYPVRQLLEALGTYAWTRVLLCLKSGPTDDPGFSGHPDDLRATPVINFGSNWGHHAYFFLTMNDASSTLPYLVTVIRLRPA